MKVWQNSKFYEITYGRLIEVSNQLIIAQELNMLITEKLNELRKEIDTIARMLSGLRIAQK